MGFLTKKQSFSLLTILLIAFGAFAGGMLIYNNNDTVADALGD